MRKLSLTIAAVLVFGVANTVFAQQLNRGAARVGPASGFETDEAQHAVSISIPEVFILDIESGSGETDASTVINLTPDVPTGLEAGQIVEFEKTDASLTLNYTSIVSAKETRNVTVGLDTDLPAGIKLEVVAGAIMGGNSVGSIGTPTTAVSLASGAVNLITGIGTGYTGNGNANGHRLTYTLSTDANAFASIVGTNGTPISRVVTYTITD